MNQQFKHQNMLLSYEGELGKSFRMASLSTTALPARVNGIAPNFTLALNTDDMSSLEGCGCCTGHYADATCTSFEADEHGITARYLCADNALEVTTALSFIPEADAVRQINSVKNVSDKPVTLTHFGSAHVSGILDGALSKWFRNDDRIKIHYCLSHWQGEAQWKTASLSDLGVTKQTAHSWDTTAFRLRSVGSWSTGRYHPLIVAEDTETGVVWYMELEGGFNWTLELGNRNGHGMDVGTFYLEANAADEETGFVKELLPGETFTAAPVLFGCTNGAFDEAAGQLLAARRATTVAKWDTPDNSAPACFNTYMDCVWGAGNAKTLPGLIRAAADAGCEVFCLDAGWYLKGLGEWSVGDAQFGEGGLQGVFDSITEAGMKPGAWLEIESLDPNTPMTKNRVLMRNGVSVQHSHFADYTDPKQCAYIEGIFDKLYAMGVRFIKNDYNRSVMFGAQMDGCSPAEGLKKATEAFYALIDRVKNKYSDLKIENCGSGAMRCDNGTLRHFELQSTSDQELYFFNPSIVSGMAGCLAPEKAGIWSYPYPVSFYENRSGEDIYASSERMAQMADGEQTVFNMVNALCGVLYLSGRIDKADEYNKKLIREGVETYKAYRSHVHTSFPVWPCGHLNLRDRTHSALGFVSADGKKMTLAVWKFEDADEVIRIDLSKYFGGKKPTVSLVYPSIETEYRYYENTSVLAVCMPKDYTARYFEIDLG